MFGLPLWVYLALPLIPVGILFWSDRRTKKLEAEARARDPRLRVIAPMWPMYLSAFLFLIIIGLNAAAMGQSDENRVRDECAKHGMAPFREGFGHSQCIDPKTHQLRAFEDVR